MPSHTARRAAQMSPILFALACGAYAQTSDATGHSGHAMAAPAATTQAEAAPLAEMSDADRAYIAATDGMHENMAIAMSGDADVDFARGMIAHHQGAIEMAQVVLDHGDDPEMKALAEEIITAQKAEIARMETWLQANAPTN